jgi:hypothetical protein
MAIPEWTMAETSINAATGDRVVLLHGLARTWRSMRFLDRRLTGEGFHTCNVAYPSRRYPVETLASDFVLPAILTAFGEGSGPIHFVTHSLGGIIVRHLAASGAPITFGRVVMLAPPNRGSEVVDRLRHWWPFRAVNGPAGSQLGTSADSLPNTLGPAPFEVGIIAGSRSINLILSTMIEGVNDGKVSLERAKLEGMADFLVVPASHPFIMNNREAIDQTVYFLRHGTFRRPDARGGAVGSAGDGDAVG